MKKNQKIKKIALSKETLAHLQPESSGLRKAAGGNGNTGPSCDIFRYCTLALDCGGGSETC